MRSCKPAQGRRKSPVPARANAGILVGISQSPSRIYAEIMPCRSKGGVKVLQPRVKAVTIKNQVQPSQELRGFTAVSWQPGVDSSRGLF